MSSENKILFPRFYSWAIRLIQEDLRPDHFYDLLVLSFVLGAFLFATLTMGMVSAPNSDVAPRLLAAALGLHAFGLLSRQEGFRLRWVGGAVLPFALWILWDSGREGGLWRGREQASVAFCAVVAFWLVTHHVRHKLHRWFLHGGMAVIAAMFSVLIINRERNLLPRLVECEVDGHLYAGQSTGPFATPGAFGAFLLLCSLPVFSLLIAPAVRPERRIAAGLTLLFAVFALWSTHHGPSWLGACAGMVITMAILFVRRVRAYVACTVVAGVAFLIPKGYFDSGIFRAEVLRADQHFAALGQASLEIFKTRPLAGCGSGGFASAFEAVRPWGFDYDPVSAGGFLHQVAAENGAIGLLLILIPVIVLWVGALRLCLSIPNRMPYRERQFGVIMSYVPESRVALTGLLAGTFGAGIALAFDCPGPSTSLALGFAICGGIAAKMVFGDRFALLVKVATRISTFAGILVGLAWISLLLFFVTPVFESAAYARYAESILLECDNTSTIGSHSTPHIVGGARKAAMLRADSAAKSALELCPDNARAASVLSGVHASMLRFEGTDPSPGEGLAAARLASQESGGEVVGSLALLSELRSAGDTAGTLALIERLRVSAPRNIPLALLAAEFLIDAGRIKEAAPIINQVLTWESWNPRAKELNKLVNLNH